jgi:hypothetical protein
MAAKLDSFPFPTNSGGRPLTYDWDSWLDGNIWHLKSGEDFCLPVERFRKYAYKYAWQNRGLRIRTAILEDGIAIQALLSDT